MEVFFESKENMQIPILLLIQHLPDVCVVSLEWKTFTEAYDEF